MVCDLIKRVAECQPALIMASDNKDTRQLKSLVLKEHEMHSLYEYLEDVDMISKAKAALSTEISDRSYDF